MKQLDRDLGQLNGKEEGKYYIRELSPKKVKRKTQRASSN